MLCLDLPAVKIIQNTCTFKTISPDPHCKPSGWSELGTKVLKILEGFGNGFKSICSFESSEITSYYFTKSPSQFLFFFFWFINPELPNFNHTLWINAYSIFMSGCSDFIHIFSIMEIIWPNRGLLHKVHLYFSLIFTSDSQKKNRGLVKIGHWSKIMLTNLIWFSI